MTSTIQRQLSPSDVRAFEPEAKLGILATLDQAAHPHITLLTSLRAKGPSQLMFGQFVEGRSKHNVADEPRVAFAVMNAARWLWRGRARWTHTATEGADYELYNRLPMFRYNSYLGIHRVHYLDLISVEPARRLSLARLAAGQAIAALVGSRSARTYSEPALTSWARRHLSKPTTLHFLAYRAADGFPTLIPVAPCRAIDRNAVAIAPTVYRTELRAIPAGAELALFGINLEMESVLVRGTFAGFERRLGLPVGRLDVEWVYNSMPPLPGTIFPREPLRPVTSFE